MKNIAAVIVVLSLVILASCSSASTFLGGSWSFKSVSYTAYSCVGSTTLKTLEASTASTNGSVNGSEVDDVVCHFSSFPPPAGTYTITNVPVTSANQMYVVMNIGTKVYTVDVSGSTSATVTVNGSKISVSIPPVTFSNTLLQATDNGSFTANLNQEF